VLTQSGRVFGPLLGGLLISNVSLAAAYALDAATFAVAFLLFLGLPPLLPAARRRFELASIVEGLAYVRREPILASTFIADLIAMIIGLPRAVFPALALSVFHVGAQGLGYLYAAPAAGAMVGLLFSGLTNRVRREGLAVIVSIMIWGAAIALFGMTPWFYAALALLALAGAADMVSALFRQTILWSVVPDELRGRMSAVHILVVAGGPLLGDFEAGTAADVLGLRTSVVAGGLACMVGVGILGLAVPQFPRWVDPRHRGRGGDAATV
jgi:MFS family permease